MAEAISPTTGRCYGVARVCRVWKVPRSSFYAARQPKADTTAAAEAPARRGPKPTVSDAALLTAIRADLALDRRGPPQGLGPAAGDRRHPGGAQAGATADARARPALAASRPDAHRRRP